jgi:hypothetical protein
MSARVQSTLGTGDLGALGASGFSQEPGPFDRPEDAWRQAADIIGAAHFDPAPVDVIGNFVIPPLNGPPSRDFQTLHFDFGLPLAPVVPADIARVTALHVPSEKSPSVRSNPAFLCGTEFANLSDEMDFFADRALHLDAVAIEVSLRPGALLVFDNLAVAHGRRGVRQPGELHQRVFGHRALSVDDQVELRDRVLAAFAT